MEPEVKGDHLSQLPSEKLEKYQLFLDWFKKNGGLYSESEIIFPAVFSPGEYLGVATNKPIKANKVILAIPQTLCISLSKVRSSPLKAILDKHDMFHDEEDSDMEFNVLALYLIYERMKKKDSFWYPYFNVVDPPETVLNWSEKQIEEVNDPYLRLYAKDLKAQYEPLYEKFLKVIVTNSKLFPEKPSYEEFITTYSMVTTRCFGWGIPQTMIIPFADFLNHSQEGVYHYMLNVPFESGKSNPPKDYIVKHPCLDLSLFGLQPHQHKKYEPNARVKFIMSYFPELKQSDIVTKQQEHFYLDKIHSQHLLANPSLPLLLSSDSQDNDSQDQQQSMLTQTNFLSLQKRQKPLGPQQLSQLKQPRYQKPKLPINRQFEQQMQWPWWQHTDNKTYFIVSTSKAMQAKQQLYNSYGKRSNRFLLIWYGFTLEDNKYNSVPFRMWMWRGDKGKTRPLVFDRCVAEEEWDDGIVIGDEIVPTDMLTREFKLKESGLNCELIIYLRLHLLANTSKYLQGYIKQTSNLKINYPADLSFELQVFTLYKAILTSLSTSYHSSTESLQQQTTLLSKPQKLNHRQLFASRMRLSNKRILVTQMEIVEATIEILKLLMEKKTMREAMERVKEQGRERVWWWKRVLEYLRLIRGIL